MSLERERSGRLTLINLLAIVSFVTVLAVLWLRHIPQVFPFGRDLGELVFELGIAYLSGWIFNLLVVELPRDREQARVRSAIGGPLWIVANEADDLVNDLEYIAQLPLGEIDTSQPIPADQMERMCAAIPLAGTLPGGTQANLEFIQERLAMMQAAYLKIAPFMSRLDVELIMQIQRVQASPFLLISSHLPIDPATGGSHLLHLGSYHKLLIKYVEDCASLKILLRGKYQILEPIGHQHHDFLWLHRLNDRRRANG